MAAEKNERKKENAGLVSCSTCRNFSHFANQAGHNSPHALGKCGSASWDGNRGQWAMLRHPCKNFQQTDQEPERRKT